jgi:hypothetical protein
MAVFRVLGSVSVLRNWNFSKEKSLEKNERKNEDLVLCALCGKPFFLARIELIDQPRKPVI